jgi:hypothetical protein
MYKTIFLAGMILYSLTLSAQPAGDIWNVKFYTIDNYALDMRLCAGKKIVIVSFDASNPNFSLLGGLDSLVRRAGGNMAAIAIPVLDFGEPMQKSLLLSKMRDSLQLAIPVAAISYGKRGRNQHLLMQWLTTSSKKNHFNINLEQPEEIFIVSTQGLLYGVLHPGSSPNWKLVSEILSREPAE